MNLNVTQENLYLFLPGKISRMAQMYAKRFNVGINEALDHIYNSGTYRLLEDETTKLWHYGPTELLRQLIEEEADHPVPERPTDD